MRSISTATTSSQAAASIPNQRRRSLSPVKNMGNQQQVYIFRSTFYPRVTFSFINLKYLCTSMTPSVMTGDWTSQKNWHYHCQVRWSLVFWGGDDPGCLGDGSHCTEMKHYWISHHTTSRHNQSIDRSNERSIDWSINHLIRRRKWDKT